MARRFLVLFFRRALFVLVLICLGCSAQSNSPDLTRLVEKHVRKFYSVPASVKLTIGTLRSSEFPNYDALTITFDNDGKKTDYEFLLSKDRKTLLRVTRLDLTRDPNAEIMKKIDVSGRPTRGNKDAKVVVVNYDDFECPFCGQMHETLFPSVFKEYADRVLFIYKDYPLEEIHPWAVHAAVNANCLAAQNADAYWDYADYLHHNRDEINQEYKNARALATPAKTDKDKPAAQDKDKKEASAKESQSRGLAAANGVLDKLAVDQGQKHNLDVAKLQACIKTQDEKAVRASMREGDGLGVDATPALFVNGEKVEGAVPIDELRATLDQALLDAGVTPPEHKPAAGAANAPATPSK